MFEVGRVCLKTAGREAGKYCVIVKKMDENFVLVTGPKSLTRVKRRRCNINHLEPIVEKVKIKSDASDAEILKAYQDASISARLGLEKPGKTKEKPREKREVKREKPKKGRKKEKPREEKRVKKPGKKAKPKKKTKEKPKKAKGKKKAKKK